MLTYNVIKKTTLLFSLALLFLVGIATTAFLSHSVSTLKKAYFERQALIESLPEEKTVSLSNNDRKPVEVSLNNDMLSIEFPQNTLDETRSDTLELQSVVTEKEPEENSIVRFSLKLLDTQSKTPIEAIPFSSQAQTNGENYYTLTYNYSNLNAQYADSSVTFVWLNPQTGTWEPIPTENDVERNIITAKINHMSDFGVDAAKAQVFSPTIKNWETDGYTGSVTYSMPLDILPAVGGFGPNLAVTYNSNRVNGLTKEQRGSWLGAGWDLNLPEIRFEEYKSEGSNNCNPTASDTIAGTRKRGPQYSLILNGSEYPLIWIGDELNTEVASRGSYGKFITQKGGITVKGHYGSYNGVSTFGDACRNKVIIRFEAQTKDGTLHIFDGSINNSITARKIKGRTVPSKYGITKQTDLHGNEIKYNWQQETSNGYIIASYPEGIGYNYFTDGSGGRSRVSFKIIPKCKDKPEAEKCVSYLARDGNTDSEQNYEKSALSEIVVYSSYYAENDSRNVVYKTYRFPFDKKDNFHTITGIETYAYGAPSNKNKLVTSTFAYTTYPVGLGFECLTRNRACGSEPWAGADQHTWDELAHCANVHEGCIESGTDVAICESQRIQLAVDYIGDCHGDNKLYQSSPNHPTGQCPRLAYAGSCAGNTSTYVTWSKENGPFLSKVENGYGGIVQYSYTPLYSATKKNPLNRVVITKREVYNQTDSTDKHIVTEYIYHKHPTSESTVRPNKAGGFSYVTIKDSATNLLTTTFYYPLAAKNTPQEGEDESYIQAQNDPYFGAPLRTVVHKIDGSNENVYSDVFNTYSFVPIYNPSFGLDFPQGHSSALLNNLLTEGVGTLVPAVIDSFTPNTANFTTVPVSTNSPFARNYSANPNVLHTQTINQYDRWGNTVKTTNYALVNGFATGLNYDLGTTRSITSSEKEWWKNDNAKKFTYVALPFTPYLFVKLAPSTVTASGNPSTDPLMRKIAHTAYNYDTQYVQKNMTGLVSSSFLTQSLASMGMVSNPDIYSYTLYSYDEPGYLATSGVYGKLTSARITNTNSPVFPGETPNPNSSAQQMVTHTKYDQFGNAVETIDAKGNSTVISYQSPSQPYNNILPVSQSVVVKNPDGSYKDTFSSVTAYNSKWLPETTTDANGTTSKAEYDCLGRLQSMYKPDSATGTPSILPSVQYYYFDYQGDGCGNGATRPLGSSTPPLPHLRTKTLVTDTEYLTTDQISDGMGNPLQTQTLKTKVNDQFKSVLSETGYNNRGLKTFVSEPATGDPIDNSAVPSYKAGLTLTKTSYEYDELGRTVSTTDALGNTSKTQYAGLSTKVFDPNNDASSSNATFTETVADGLGRAAYTQIVNLDDSNGQFYTLRTIPTYNAMDKVVESKKYTCTDSSCSNKTELYTVSSGIDNIGRTLYSKDPDLGIWKFAYDENGNINEQIDANGNKIQISYDSLNRPVKKTYPGNARGGLPTIRDYIETVYDNGSLSDCSAGAQTIYKGKIAVLKDTTGETRYCYDKRGRLVSQKQIIDKNIDGEPSGEEISEKIYNYYNTDAVKSYTVLPSGRTVNNSLNESGQVIGTYVTSSSGTTNLVTNSLYNEKGLSVLYALGNNLQIEQKFDLRGRLTGKCVGADCTNGTSKLLHYQYPQRDKTGNILRVLNTPSALPETTSPFSISYTYNRAYELTKATGTDPANSCSALNGLCTGLAFCSADERVSAGRKDCPVNSICCTYSASSPSPSPVPTGSLIAASYTYDQEGNMTSKVEGASTINLMYDTSAGTSQRHAPKTVNGFTYRYDANGNLLEDEARTYVWDFDNKPVKITMKSNQASSEFAYDGTGARVFKRDIEGISSPSPTIASIIPTASSTPLSCPVTCAKRGDSNCDNAVNEADYTLWLSQYMVYQAGGTIEPADRTADFDCSPEDTTTQSVSLSDYMIWAENKEE